MVISELVPKLSKLANLDGPAPAGPFFGDPLNPHVFLIGHGLF